ncbi:hypothetical protein [Salmonella phage PS3-1]|nr:hypothetical protein [Salmonella phage PS3-1]
MMEVAITLLVILVWVIFIISRISYTRVKNLEAQIKQQQLTVEKLLELQRADSIRILQIEKELDV